MALEHGGVVGPVVALVAANGKIVGVRLLHVVPQIGQVGRPVWQFNRIFGLTFGLKRCLES